MAVFLVIENKTKGILKMPLKDYFYIEGVGPNSITKGPNKFAGEWIVGGGVHVGKAIEAARQQAAVDGKPFQCVFKHELIKIGKDKNPEEFAKYMGVSEEVLQRGIKDEKASITAGKRKAFEIAMSHLRNN